MTKQSLELGNSIEARLDENKRRETLNLQSLLEKCIKFRNRLIREFLAEMFGTFLLVLIGLAGLAQFTFKYAENFLAVNMAFGLALIVAVLVTGKVSGCHVNPAVSFAMLLTGRLSLIRFIVYVAAQFLGAFVGAALVYVIYYDALVAFRGGLGTYTIETAGIYVFFSCN
jgi:glycerol uptake facilitator-like aquaporin